MMEVHPTFHHLLVELGSVPHTLVVFVFALILDTDGLVAFEDIVFKHAFFYFAIGESHLAPTMLDAILPLTFVHAAICPLHTTLAISLVLVVLSFVYVTACPCEDAMTLFLIELPFAFI